MKKTNKILGVIVGLVIFLGFLGCNGNNSQINNNEKAIKIGVILPLTGRLAQMGEVERNAMLLAEADVNKDKKKIELIFEDGKGQPNEAITSARKLIDIDKVDLILTSTTGASLAVEPITTERKMNLVTFCMDPDVAKKSDYVIRYYQGINEESNGILGYFDRNPNVNKVGILYGRIPVWEKAVNDIYTPYFENKKIDVVYRESYDIGETNFKNTILKLKSSGANQLILLGYGFEYENIFKSLIDEGLLGNIQIIGGWGFLYTGLKKEQLEGIVVSGPDYVFNQTGSANDFFNAYKSKYGNAPNFDAAFAYTAITGIATQIKPDSINKPFKGLFKNSGKITDVVGEYSFNEHGEMITHFGLGIYKDGQIVKY
jgi:branched-chain amino acid transport system substrate-binding protein